MRVGVPVSPPKRQLGVFVSIDEVAVDNPRVGSMPDAGHVEFTLNGTTIDPASDPDWSYTPFDGLHPRRYENIELRPKTVDAGLDGRHSRTDAERERG